ncbi:hypothetical protein GH808_12945 [Acetobacterium fimetarium]|uniref:Uncharacterized protein n=1 Tax=Acetobacterium fimetarium TaxID=52691 RepID=A0ABR6WXG2_9FIRM|nr:hypothetical protein [Acetobacterium fimetarium]MBC3805324.1 hypothetical protein [Acetobacterium fimetarium]
MKKTKTPEKINTTAILAVVVFSAFIALFNETSLIMIMLVYIVVCIGVGCTMTASQLKALNNAASQEVAIATGFSSATLVLAVFVFVAFCLSFVLNFDKHKIPSALDIKAAKVNENRV